MEGNSSHQNTVKEFEDDEEEELEMVKRKISSHPLFRVLIQKHAECLQMSLGNMEKSGANDHNRAHCEINKSRHTSSELDDFMEAYSTALGDLRDAMKEPLHESTAFIDSMYSQLKELVATPVSTGMSSNTLDIKQENGSNMLQ